MDKMFKRSILGAAVAAVAAMAHGTGNGKRQCRKSTARQRFLSGLSTMEEGKTTTDVDNESRFGPSR